MRLMSDSWYTEVRSKDNTDQNPLVSAEMNSIPLRVNFFRHQKDTSSSILTSNLLASSLPMLHPPPFSWLPVLPLQRSS